LDLLEAAKLRKIRYSRRREALPHPIPLLNPDSVRVSEKKRVLVVCPDERLGDIRCMILHSHGYDALCVCTPADARQAWSPGAYQLILVDVQSDPDSALSLCNEFKSKDQTQLVALMSQHHIYIPPSACPDEVIPKAEGPRVFVQKVKELLEGAAEARS
jgi:DNA-binding response OmpR family regulator